MDPDPYLSYLLINCKLVLLSLPFSQDSLFFLLLILLLLCSGLFSGSETAIFSLSSADVEQMLEKESPSTKAFAYFKQRQRQLLALILVCNTFVNIGIALVVERLMSSWLPQSLYEAWGLSIKNLMALDSFDGHQIGYGIYFLVAVIGATALILLFGEVMPKIYSLINSRKFALLMAVPLRLLSFVFWPLTHLMVLMTIRVERKLLEKKVGLQSTSKEDLDTAIDLAVTEGNDSERQVDILKGIIKFNDVAVKQVMTQRTDVHGLEFNLSYRQLLDKVKESGFSRLPVFQEDFDQITGILYAKDLIAHLDEPEEFEWQSLIRTSVLYVPESKRINELLDDFRDQHMHLAFVVDEYGGTSGIVTLEDIMEEIVGEIKDEFDEQHELNYVKLDPNNYLFDGKTLINDMCRVLKVDIVSFDRVRGNADSIAGLVLEKLGEMPHKDQVVDINGLKFTIANVNKKRIEQIKITI